MREGELIRSLRPPHNVDGAYSFLYPSVGLGTWDKHLVLCLTSEPEAYASADLHFYGCFRSRLRVAAAFSALVEILGILGHREKSTRLGSVPRPRGSRILGFRQVPTDVIQALPAFLTGDERALPGLMARLLLAHPRARRDAAAVQEQLQALRSFFEQDAVRLRNTLQRLGLPACHGEREERDALFIRAGFATSPTQ